MAGKVGCGANSEQMTRNRATWSAFIRALSLFKVLFSTPQPYNKDNDRIAYCNRYSALTFLELAFNMMCELKFIPVWLYFCAYSCIMLHGIMDTLNAKQYVKMSAKSFNKTHAQ